MTDTDWLLIFVGLFQLALGVYIGVLWEKGSESDRRAKLLAACDTLSTAGMNHLFVRKPKDGDE